MRHNDADLILETNLETSTSSLSQLTL